jgi:hypothetical protein
MNNKLASVQGFGESLAHTIIIGRTRLLHFYLRGMGPIEMNTDRWPVDTSDPAWLSYLSPHINVTVLVKHPNSMMDLDQHQ